MPNERPRGKALALNACFGVDKVQEKSMNIKKAISWFPAFARWTANASGKPVTFGVAVLFIIIWAAMGPRFGYSDTWQLVINTSTTIVTFLMVFLIQSTQNHDTQALQLKLDELIRCNESARNLMLDLEHLDDEHLERLQKIYERIGSKARNKGND